MLLQKNKHKGTTTQTGPDHLCRYSKQKAIEYLAELWKINPRWVPRTIDKFNYPFISSKEFTDISGETLSIPVSYLYLLDIQRKKGFLNVTDLPVDSSYFKVNCIDIVGSYFLGDKEKNSNRFVLDPINGIFLRLPDSIEGKELYHKFYTARFQYIESIPNAFKIIGKEKINILHEESAIEAFSRTIVIVCGLGTGGGETAIRLGKQLPNVNMALIDGGVFGPENIDRQAATPYDCGLNKSISVASKIFQINPMLQKIICIPHYIDKQNTNEIFDYILQQYDGKEKPIIQVIDEVDVTEEATLQAKAELHEAVISLAAKLQTPIYVHWSLDVGASAEIVGTCCYTGNEKKIFQGAYSKKIARLPAMLAMYKLVPKNSIGLEMMEDIRRRLAKDGKMDHISQTGLSAIGVAKIISTRVILTSLGFGKKLVHRNFKDDLRGSLKLKYRLLVGLKLLPLTFLLILWGSYSRYRYLLKLK